MKTKEEILENKFKEFCEKGYLRETNRNFFHPLGLALEIVMNYERNK